MINPFDEILSEIACIKQAIKEIPASHQDPPAEIITGEELARRLQISEPTLIKWRKKNKISFIVIGSAIRYNWPNVLEKLEQSK